MSDLPPVGRDGWRTVGIASAAVFMVSMEITVISLAFPEIREQFSEASESALSWIFSAYNIGVASLLLIGGWLSERYGHKRIFLTGVSIFLLGSVAAGFAVSSEMLIGARIVQAAGGALQAPAGLALVLAAAPPARHQMAIGIWGAAGALAAAAGPTLGALLVEGFGWRAVFLINIPVIGVALVLGRRWLPDTPPSPGTDDVDLVSVPLAGVGVGALVLGIVQGETWGWSSAAVIGSFVLGLVLMTAFVVRSSRHSAPLFDLGLYRLRSYAVANVASVFFAFAFFGWLVPLPDTDPERVGLVGVDDRVCDRTGATDGLLCRSSSRTNGRSHRQPTDPDGVWIERRDRHGVVHHQLRRRNRSTSPTSCCRASSSASPPAPGFHNSSARRCAMCRHISTPWAAPDARRRSRWRSPLALPLPSPSSGARPALPRRLRPTRTPGWWVSPPMSQLQ